MQVPPSITEPDYSVLLDGRLLNKGSDISFERFLVPRVKVELVRAQEAGTHALARAA